MNRFEFLKGCGVFCVGGFGLQIMMNSCGSTNHIAQSKLINNKLSINKTEFEIKDANFTKFRKFVIIRPEGFHFPICLFRITESDYSAVLMECTHRSCELHNQGDYLMCPCHGSEFSNKGIVQNPPAEIHLKTFQTTFDHDQVYIQL